jgi:signal transduction histidine kinase
MPYRTFHTRLLGAAVVPLVVAGLAASWIASAVLARELERRVVEQTEHMAQVLGRGDLPLSTELLRRVASLGQADVYLLDAGGRVLGSSGAAPSPALAAQLARPHAPASTRRADIGGEPMLIAYAPLAVGDARYAALAVTRSLADARAATRRAALAIGLAVLTATALLAGLVHVLMGTMTRPLAALTDFARHVGAGERGLPPPQARDDELRDLARALSELSTQIVAYERQLEDRTRAHALSDLAARIAHEVRNPLTGLKMHLQMLAERAAPDTGATLALLLDEVRRLELIVGSALTLSRSAAPALAPASLSALAREVVELMRPSIEHTGIAIDCVLAELAPAPLDGTLLRQALLNLVVNARDALGARGRITVATACDPVRRRIMLQVDDTGPGFATEIMAGDLAPTSDKPFGLGLGLRLCREVAALHGGALLLGRNPEGGARATIELPLPAA